MSDTKNNGGPAFPMRDPNYEAWLFGMTLRDYFAAKAMQGLLASPMTLQSDGYTSIADRAYNYADAMLKAREK